MRKSAGTCPPVFFDVLPYPLLSFTLVVDAGQLLGHPLLMLKLLLSDYLFLPCLQIPGVIALECAAQHWAKHVWYGGSGTRADCPDFHRSP